MAYDWILIKSEYVSGYTDEKGDRICPTLDQLCERHGCSFSTISTRSSKGKWKQERQLFGKKKATNIQEEKLNNFVEEVANIDNKALTISNKGLECVEKRIDNEDLSNHDLMKLSTTASNFHKMGRLALDEPTEHIKEDNKTDVKVNLHERITDYEQKFTNTSPEGSDSSDNI